MKVCLVTTSDAPEKLLNAINVLCSFYKPLVEYEGRIKTNFLADEISLPVEIDEDSYNFVNQLDYLISELDKPNKVYRGVTLLKNIKSLIPVNFVPFLGANSSHNLFIQDYCLNNDKLLQAILFEEFDESILRLKEERAHESLHNLHHKGFVKCLYKIPKSLERSLDQEMLVKEFIDKSAPLPCKKHKNMIKEVITGLVKN